MAGVVGRCCAPPACRLSPLCSGWGTPSSPFWALPELPPRVLSPAHMLLCGGAAGWGKAVCHWFVVRGTLRLQGQGDPCLWLAASLSPLSPGCCPHGGAGNTLAWPPTFQGWVDCALRCCGGWASPQGSILAVPTPVGSFGVFPLSVCGPNHRSLSWSVSCTKHWGSASCHLLRLPFPALVQCSGVGKGHIHTNPSRGAAVASPVAHQPGLGDMAQLFWEPRVAVSPLGCTGR